VNTPASTSETCTKARAQRAEYQRRYPLADKSLPLPEQMAADEATLRAVMRERSTRQFVTNK